MQSKEQFQEIREQESQEIPVLEPTPTQLYHSRSRIEGEAVLMNGGCYNHKGTIFNMVKYTLSGDYFKIYARHLIDKDGNYKYNKGLMLETLRDIVPCTAHEQNLLETCDKSSGIYDWLDITTDKHVKTNKGTVLSKNSIEGLNELNKEKEVIKIKEKQKEHELPKDLKASIKNGFKDFKKSRSI